MKGGGSTTSAHAPLHQAVGSFFGGVKQFAAHAESEARELRTSVEKPPLSGTQGYSSLFMKRMKTDVSRLQKDMAAMHSQFTSAVSFEEIIEVCMGMYKQNEVWREELEEVLEQEHGVRRVEPPPLLSPAHSYDEQNRDGEESAEPEPDYYAQGERGLDETASKDTSEWSVSRVERTPGECRAAASSRTPKQPAQVQREPQSGSRQQPSARGDSRSAAQSHASNPLLYSPSADLGLSAASLEIIAKRSVARELPRPSEPTELRYQRQTQGAGAHLSSFTGDATPSFAQPTSAYHPASAPKTPTSSSHYASFSSSSSAYSNAPKTPTSSYRPSYAMVASPEYSSSSMRTPQHHSVNHSSASGRYNAATPVSAQRGHTNTSAMMSAITPITPRSFHIDNGGTGELDLDDLSPIRPSADGGQLYRPLPATTPTVDLRYKHLLANSPVPARVAAPPLSSLYPPIVQSSSYSSSSSFSTSASAYSKYAPLSAASSSSSSSSYASALPPLSSTATPKRAPTSYAAASASQPPASLSSAVTEQEYNGCASFLKGQISLPQLNEVIGKIGAFYAANSLTYLSEDQLRNDLGLGAKCKAAILFLLHLKRISSQFQAGSSVYVPT